mmetsp:Transcript_19978/g.56378  ORF Transcript_19978/g.56378 Transcript_19978/m.56378 type:complete len:233 (+) Transcript_19978:214-912(+)
MHVMRLFSRRRCWVMAKLSFALASAPMACIISANLSKPMPSSLPSQRRSQKSVASSGPTCRSLSLVLKLSSDRTASRNSSKERRLLKSESTLLKTARNSCTSAFIFSFSSATMSSSSWLKHANAFFTITAVMRFCRTNALTMMTSVKMKGTPTEYFMSGRATDVQLSSVVTWKSVNEERGTVKKKSCATWCTAGQASSDANGEPGISERSLPMRYTPKTEEMKREMPLTTYV